MKEIKFRAWDQFNECFHYPASESTASLAKFFTQMADFQAAGNNIQIMQFTCLKDKEGKEVYEGDVGHDGYHAYKIVFHSGCFALEYRDGSKLFVTDLDFQIDIIGNIHQNPELLN